MKFNSKVGEGTRELVEDLRSKPFPEACKLLLKYGNMCFEKGYTQRHDDEIVSMMEEAFTDE